jgi:transcriptional regulator with XRE-family HTH domain
MPKPTRPPTARLRRLASELLALRQKANMNREEVAEHTGINPATLYKIEKAQARPQPRTLKALLHLYSVTQDKREALTALLREAGQQTWLQPYNEELSEEYNTLMSFEAEARALWTYQMSLIPGLLQTESYARTVLKGMAPLAGNEEIERRVETRLRRQEVLVKETPLRLWAIVDEAALRRRVGDADTMRGQITHLHEVAQRPEVTLQVLSFDAGPHPAMLGAFVILKFDEPVAPDIVYTEGLSSDLFLDDEPAIVRYTETFDQLRAIAWSPSQTENFLARLAKEA